MEINSKILRIIFSLVFWFIFMPVLFAGSLQNADTLRINGKLVLYLGSDDYWQDGYSYGYLLGHRIKPLFDDYLIPVAAGGVENYNAARSIYKKYFQIDEKYLDLSAGILAGIKAKGISLYSSELRDTLTYIDLLILNSVPDLTAFSSEWYYSGPGCSDLTSWGDATTNDPQLKGETVISRNLDWDPHSILLNNMLIIVWATNNPDKQSFMTFGFIGQFGALSGINVSGVATFQNMGNLLSFPQGSGFYPVNFAMRNGLEARDYNGDGVSSPRDVTDAVKEHRMSSSFIIHSAGPSSLSSPAEILEIHNLFGNEIRTKSDNPGWFGDNLLATNHFRKLKPAEFCERYQLVSDSIYSSSLFDIKRNWDVLALAGNSLTLQTIQFIPVQRKIRFAFAEEKKPSNSIYPSDFDINSISQLLDLKINDQKRNGFLEIFPNPASHNVRIYLNLKGRSEVICNIIDVNGRTLKSFRTDDCISMHCSFEMQLSGIPKGIYFVNVQVRDIDAGLYYHETKRMIIS